MLATKYKINNILTETRSLVCNNDTFQLLVEDLVYVDLEAQLRLSKWLDFLNENYHKNPSLFRHTVTALFNILESNKLYKVQSIYEYELSFHFYKKIFFGPVFIPIDSAELAESILLLALIYSKYPGMQVRSFEKAVDIIKNGVTTDTLHQVFEILFVKYENPHFLTDHLFTLTVIEIDLLMYILQGNNMSTYPLLPFPISKKESYIVLFKLPTFTFQNQHTTRTLVAVKLMHATHTEEFIEDLLEYFLECNRIFVHHLEDFIREIYFWCDAFVMAHKMIDEELLSDITFEEFIDYLIYVKYQVNTSYNLKKQTAQSICLDIIHWNTHLDFEKCEASKNKKWKGSGMLEVEFLFEENRYLFKQITTGHDLYTESLEMKHCVFSYLDACLCGESAIWSMQKLVNGVFVRQLTIEIVDTELSQISGIRNCEYTDQQIDVIEEWTGRMHYTF